jgi:uncharacterized protein (TIGR02594 family)
MAPAWLKEAFKRIGEKGGTNGCALFVGQCLEASGLPPTLSPKARSYLGYGTQLRRPKIGCLAILWRKDPKSTLGHIGFFLKYTPDKRIIMISSHFGLVSIKSFPKTNLLGYRWPDEGVRRNSIQPQGNRRVP